MRNTRTLSGTAANWELMCHHAQQYRALCTAPGTVPALTMICYAQHFSELHAGVERQVYHNTPAWQWRPIMQLATGRLLLRCATSRWKGPQRTTGACPCDACHGCLEDPAHYVLECAGLADLRARYPAVMDAAAAARTVGPPAAMRALFQPKHFAELANFLVLAKRRRFAADGAVQMQAAAAGVQCWRAMINSVHFGPPLSF
jgi:hypothetical protein